MTLVNMRGIVKNKTMDNEQILKQAIAKSVKNGWKWKKECLPIIFSDDFAQAFWGDEPVDGIIPWKHHLGEMSVSGNPLEYLKKFL